MQSSSQVPELQPRDNSLSEDRGKWLILMFWIWSFFVILLLALRFHVRSRMRVIGPDDWMMVLGTTSFVSSACLITYSCSVGVGRHMHYLSEAQLYRAMKWSWLAQPPVILMFGFIKTSIALLMLRLLARITFWRRYILYTIIVVVLVGNLLAVIFTYAQCTPTRALWNTSIKAKCWDPHVQERYNFFLGACNVTTDVVLAILPVTFIPQLNIEFKKKVNLCILMGLGIFAGIAGIVKISTLVHLAKREEDFTWSVYHVFAWSGVEGFIMIVCGNVPPLQPLWDRFITRKRDSSYFEVKQLQPFNEKGLVPSFMESSSSTASSGHSEFADGTAQVQVPGRIVATTSIRQHREAACPV